MEMDQKVVESYPTRPARFVSSEKDSFQHDGAWLCFCLHLPTMSINAYSDKEKNVRGD